MAILWLERRDVEFFYADLLDRFGGLAGPPDEDALEATLARPQNQPAYEPQSTIFELAAAYGYGFSRNHCFPDGNKRIALAAMDVFLMLNGYDILVDEAEAVVIIETLATGDRSQEELAEWLAANSSDLPEGEI
ncbi:MAG: type II toxin-antitoxin system death-on-curing family toxin [Gammaproteobacteria bacterium]|nr:type II toxin-antitoxin system death-on-curing family toxin [Gammaproteobacteria bacterium]